MSGRIPNEALSNAALAHAKAALPTAAGRELRAVPAGEALCGWSPGLLRVVHDQPVGVYELVGEAEIVIDARGRVHALDDPHLAPTTDEVHVTEDAAIAAVARLADVDARAADLGSRHLRTEAGARFIRVATRPPRPPARGEEPAPPAPPLDRYEADVNAASGRVFRYRFEPAPRAPAAAPGGAAP